MKRIAYKFGKGCCMFQAIEAGKLIKCVVYFMNSGTLCKILRIYSCSKRLNILSKVVYLKNNIEKVTCKSDYCCILGINRNSITLLLAGGAYDLYSVN